jgi:hypothetical protein
MNMADFAPTTSGPIYDPRLMASQRWLVAMQRDLNRVAQERGNFGPPVGNPQPLDPDLYDPTKYPDSFIPNRKVGGIVGLFGGVRRIG